jgi:hypothetical protein
MPFKERSTGVLTTATGAVGTLDFGASYVKPLRIRRLSVSDATVTVTVTDADGRTVYTDADDSTTATDVAIVYDAGEGSDGALVTDQGTKVFKNPLTVTLTNHDGTGFTTTIWGEV